MLQLTKAEEQIMQILWGLGEGSVQQILEYTPYPRPARTTVATILSILENKNFADHFSRGKTNVYSPVVSKEEYSKTQLSLMMKNYFNNSFASLASFFAKENNMTLDELNEMLEETRRELEDGNMK